MKNQRRAKVVIAGGGVAALEVLLGLEQLAGGLVETELISPRDDFLYRPLTVAEPFGGPPAPSFDLTELLRGEIEARRRDALVAVDAERNVLSTAGGEEIEFDAAVVAVGAHTEPVVERAITFVGAAGVDSMRKLLVELKRGDVKRIAFAVPTGVVWALPLYELALLTAAWLEKHAIKGVELTFLTPEQAPLRLFGTVPSQEVATRLLGRGIRLLTSTHASRFDGKRLSLVPDGEIEVDRVVAIPRIHGRYIRGLEHDDNGFLRTDGHGLVSGTTNVYAAGDITNFPVKQGGIAAQQADAVVRAIAARFGADVDPAPFRPVLRGLLIGGNGAVFMRAEIAGGAGDRFEVSQQPLWPDGQKIGGVYLSEFLRRHGLLPEGEVAAGN